MWFVEIELARAARSSPLPLWERSEMQRSEVSGRGVTSCEENPPPQPPPPKGGGGHCRGGLVGRFLRRMGPGSAFALDNASRCQELTWSGRRPRDEVPLPPEKLLHDAIQRLIILLARGIVRVRRGRVVRRGRRRCVVAARGVQSLLNQVAQGVAKRVSATRI